MGGGGLREGGGGRGAGEGEVCLLIAALCHGSYSPGEHNSSLTSVCCETLEKTICWKPK